MKSTKKTHFPVFAKNFRRPWMKLKNFFCQFPNPWTLRVSGMGGYTSKCEKKSKSLHPSAHCQLIKRRHYNKQISSRYLLLVKTWEKRENCETQEQVKKRMHKKISAGFLKPIVLRWTEYHLIGNISLTNICIIFITWEYYGTIP